MAVIGKRTHAAEALDILNTFKQTWDWNHIPDGWRRIGSGCFRQVFLHVDSNVVYKTETQSGYDPEYGSAAEVRNARRLRSGTDGFVGSYIRIPPTSCFTINNELVVAMERVSGTLFADIEPEGRMGFREACWELYRLGFMDMHDANFFVDADRYLVPVDMACPIRKGQGDTRTITWMRNDVGDFGKRVKEEMARRGW